MSAENKPVLVGELNPYGSDPEYALYPYPERSAGGRLCRVILGLEPREYLRQFDRVNLCVGKWSNRAAKVAADRVIEIYPDRVLVLLGSKVTAAFGAEFRPYESFLRWVSATTIVILPHPSGLCRLWNEPDSVNRARRALHRVGVDFVAPAV